MKKIFLVGLLVTGIAFAKENYSEMSTQELIEIIGFVDEKDKSAFLKELDFRIPKMTTNEKIQYEKRLSENTNLKEQIEDEE
ncbi:DUF1104 domain-containing protein [Aliarcobacter butzleri]|uniref:DUF1104 domain-containing protein n=1 Tax=Aliarcobacter butzleri TaxID=28197 RepID=UPI00189D1842|nr:DUF1104 domain-containing protein [Aliarcobacter butzleri]MBF7070010.1 DUF1104 domain-containing protein [Aliarcobacter butzleri]